MPDTHLHAPRPTTIAISIALVVIVIGFFALVLALFHKETEGGRTNVETDTGDIANRVDVEGSVVGADIVKGEISVRLSFTPKGDLVNKDGVTLSKDLRLLTNAASGLAERTLSKGRPAGSQDIIVELYDGDSAEYPFDQHKAELDIYLVSGDAANPVQVPMQFSFDGGWHGLAMTAEADPENDAGHVGLDMELRRSDTVIAVACFIMIVQMLLAAGLIVLAISLFRGRKPELSMFSWMGAMLFAFPALRNASPGIPPVLGTLSDYLAFFWAEGTVALVLVTSVALFLFKKQK
jgi:hypothetical protein